ncbi:hypothetical protein B0T20DRAFT_505606 [Sordaria brevicollis]|uniref:Uncharacterized protein n=1 Tax=Sordaria brevicollis TaxID=83679 RepID=A0AAE0UDQ7_SORBR|nr:hypothetical protein B0T20DRAFT_505606 [Sordaria brevicollis]
MILAPPVRPSPGGFDSFIVHLSVERRPIVVSVASRKASVSDLTLSPTISSVDPLEKDDLSSIASSLPGSESASSQSTCQSQPDSTVAVTVRKPRLSAGGGVSTINYDS